MKVNEKTAGRAAVALAVAVAMVVTAIVVQGAWTTWQYNAQDLHGQYSLQAAADDFDARLDALGMTSSAGTFTKAALYPSGGTLTVYTNLTVTGDVDVDGNDITSAGDMNLKPGGGDVTVYTNLVVSGYARTGNGSVGAPAVQIGTNTNGLYRVGAAQLGVAVNGSLSAVFDADGLQTGALQEKTSGYGFYMEIGAVAGYLNVLDFTNLVFITTKTNGVSVSPWVTNSIHGNIAE